VDVSEEVGSEFVVAGCEASAVLEATEHALDGVAAFVEGLAEAAFPDAIALGRDVGDRALFLDQVTDAVAVAGTVGVDDAAPGQCVQQMLGGAAVGGLSRRQQEGERSALAIGDGVDLGVAPAPADANRLEVRPPFPPAAERCALTCVLSINTSVGDPPSAASASNTARHTPLAAQRTLRL
jgi:hypothetical protein